MRIRKHASKILGAASRFHSSPHLPQIPSLWAPNSDAAPPCELNRSSWDARCPNLQQTEMERESEGNPVNCTKCEGKSVHSHLPSNGEGRHAVEKKLNAKLKGRKGRAGGVANAHAKTSCKKSSRTKQRKAVMENGAVAAGGQGNYVFYYNGFRPCQPKRRGGGNRTTKEEEEGESRENFKHFNDRDAPMISNCDVDDRNADQGEKKTRKRIKARSLKSLL